jgi:hypothetical protein
MAAEAPAPNEASRQFGIESLSPNEANRQTGRERVSPNEANRQLGSQAAEGSAGGESMERNGDRA